MHPHRPTHRPILTLAAAALALALTGCGEVASQGAATQAPSAQPSATSAAPASPAPSSATDASRPAATATGEAPASTAPSAALSTFTFPGGRFSFDHPQDWTVEGFHSVDAPVTTVTATVKDPAGRTMATVYIGGLADMVAGGGSRTVYESVPVPGLASLPAPQAHVSWFREGDGDSALYHLRLTAGTPAATPDPATERVVQTHEGVLGAEAVWDVPRPFASEEAAKAWYDSDEGRQLRALLLSLRAS
ncbi:hypothetical protein [Sinomonas mesophila]|uniref:hypothetical protein n=1 Tax=Sinomonas mesophila TaxID=1531955 RepID=UPI000986869E|nr:hypothetical protein [Sinomonas mesophila]